MGSCWRAFFALLVVGAPRAQGSAEELIAALASAPEAASAAQTELVRLGEPVAAPLAEALATAWDGSPRRSVARAAAARILMDLGPDATPALPILSRFIRDATLDPEVVELAAHALARIAPFGGERHHDLRAELIAAVGDASVRKEFKWHWSRVASALQVDAANGGLEELLEAVRSENPHALATACRALAHRKNEIEGSRELVVACLRQVVGATFDERPWRWSVGNRSAFLEKSTSDVRWLRTEASLALVSWSPNDELCWLGHCERLFDLDPEVRLSAARWLATARQPDAGRWLLEAANRGPSDVTLACLRAIERCGPDMRHLVPQLADFESHDDERVVATAQRVRRVLAPGLVDLPPIESNLDVVRAGLPPQGRIDLATERRCLVRWLDDDGGRNRQSLQDDARHIDVYHATLPRQGGPESDRMRWVPVRIGPDEFRPGMWSASCADEVGCEVVSAAPHGAVGPKRERLRRLPWIVELVPTDLDDPARYKVDPTQLWLTDDGGRSWVSIGPSQAGIAAQVVVQRAGAVASTRFLFVVDGLVVATTRTAWGRELVSEVARDRLDALRRLAVR